MLCASVPDLDGVGEDDVVGKALLQGFPNRFLGHVAVAKVGFFRNASHCWPPKLMNRLAGVR